MLTYKFMGDTRVLYRRFTEREKMPERGANVMTEAFTQDDFAQWCHNLDKFSLNGEVIRVDTTNFDTVDFNGLSESAKRFLAVL